MFEYCDYDSQPRPQLFAESDMLMGRFIVQDNIYAVFVTILSSFAMFYYLRLYLTKPQIKMHQI